jgi:hypothetical protein
MFRKLTKNHKPRSRGLTFKFPPCKSSIYCIADRWCSVQSSLPRKINVTVTNSFETPLMTRHERVKQGTRESTYKRCSRCVLKRNESVKLCAPWSWIWLWFKLCLAVSCALGKQCRTNTTYNKTWRGPFRANICARPCAPTFVIQLSLKLCWWLAY